MGDTFDFEFIRHLVKQAFHILNHEYFRAKLVNLDRVPAKTPGRPRIFFSNHSGMAFPWDAIVFNTLFWESRGLANEDLPRPLVAPMLLESKLMSPFMIENLWQRGGCLAASMENFEILMHEGKDVVMYPEGVPGIGKGFDKRYQIQKFSTSFLRMATEFNAELIPFHTVNAEYLHPYSYKSDRLNRFVQKLGVPFLPLSPLTALVPLFPWMFYFSLPANLHFVFADPIQPSDLTSKSHQELKRSDYIRMRDDIHSDFQKGINIHVEEFGQDPFRLGEFMEQLLSNPERALFTLPTGWPILITGLQKLYDDGLKKELKYTMDEFISLAARATDGLSFSLPMSWPVVFGLKGFSVDIMRQIGHFMEEELAMATPEPLPEKPTPAEPSAKEAATAENLNEEASYAEAIQLLDDFEANAKNLDRATNILLPLTRGKNPGRAFGLLCQAQYWRGMEATANKISIYEKGIEFGEAGVERDPGSVESHFWLAVNYGLLGETRGILESLFLVKPIEAHLHKAIELDESYFFGGPHRALGWVLHKLPPWPLSHGSNQEALEHMERAIELGANFPINLLYAAHICVSLKDKKKAREYCDQLLGMEINPRHSREETRYRQEALAMIAKI
ncbi:MAG TPA: TRAP transporter TatT component family protein [Leptospiraceae bacterium]|nr:TRAP transporter TatT component family protein [Leptospiraceae bacterium]HMY44625.1 TRAP transporter TatT component family protein [Leptospiraceae bacterium]HNJ33141.1 TRAP transporter TatT component family protein [Leptospiraceae bacterium]HNL68498.1 TRAP transporter TatT component family protein [Leptospiraceae bacterium]HNN59900.1 TRAP transporter TatT component family protein [Leptospiraceae bacterium]